MMAALDFPNAPSDGQLFAAPNGIIYRWAAGAQVWLVWGSGSNAAIIGSMPPSDPTPGQLWWSDELGQLFIFYDDGSSQQWCPASPVIFEPYLPLSGGTLEGDLEVEGDINAESIEATSVVADSVTSDHIKAGGNGVTYASGYAASFSWSGVQPFISISGGVSMGIPYSQSIGAFDHGQWGGPTGWGISAWDSARTNAFHTFADAVAPSDARLKKNIVDTAVDALAAINAVRVRSFIWRGEYLTVMQPYTVEMANKARPVPRIADAPVAIGLVAEEIQPHMPEMVCRRPASIPNRNRHLPNDLLYLNTKEAVPYLIRAIQQLTARVVALEAKVP